MQLRQVDQRGGVGVALAVDQVAGRRAQRIRGEERVGLREVQRKLDELEVRPSDRQHVLQQQVRGLRRACWIPFKSTKIFWEQMS